MLTVWVINVFCGCVLWYAALTIDPVELNPDVLFPNSTSTGKVAKMTLLFIVWIHFWVLYLVLSIGSKVFK